jgi:hypothetical protein
VGAVGKYSSYNIDFLLEKRIKGAGAFAIEAAWYDYDTDDIIKSEQGKAYSAGASYIFEQKAGWGKFQPFVRWQKFAADTNIDTKQFDARRELHHRRLQRADQRRVFEDQDHQRGRQRQILCRAATAILILHSRSYQHAKSSQSPFHRHPEPHRRRHRHAGRRRIGHAADTIKVGILHSLSGTMAISETSLKDVALMTIDEINAKGGVMGKKLEAVVVDPASNWPLFAEKARGLIARTRCRWCSAAGPRCRASRCCRSSRS